MPTKLLDRHLKQLVDVLEGTVRHSQVVNTFSMPMRAVVLNAMVILNRHKYARRHSRNSSEYTLFGAFSPLANELVARGGTVPVHASAIVAESKSLGLHRSKQGIEGMVVVLTPPHKLLQKLADYSHRSPAVMQYMIDSESAISAPETAATIWREQQIKENADELLQEFGSRTVLDPMLAAKLLQLVRLLEDPLCVELGRRILRTGYSSELAYELRLRLNATGQYRK